MTELKFEFLELKNKAFFFFLKLGTNVVFCTNYVGLQFLTTFLQEVHWLHTKIITVKLFIRLNAELKPETSASISSEFYCFI